MTAQTPLKTVFIDSDIELLDRDGSILAFNERVLDWAKRPEVPLLERLRYLCIVSSNLDEFFEVRADLHMAAYRSQDTKGAYNTKTFETIYESARNLVKEQYSLYNDVLLPSLKKQHIQILSHGERNAAQKKWVQDYFRREVKPLLVPVGLDPAHPFPQVANKSLNFIVRLSGKDAFGRENEIAIVKVPRSLPIVIKLPAKLHGSSTTLMVTLSSVIRSHLTDLFPDRVVGHFSQFRVTRDSDLLVDEEDVTNLRTALRHGLEHRQFGRAVRLEVSAGCSDHLANFLMHQFKLPSNALYRVHGPVNLVRLSQIIDLVDKPDLLFQPHQGSYPHQLNKEESIFAFILSALEAVSNFNKSDNVFESIFDTNLSKLANIKNFKNKILSNKLIHNKNLIKSNNSKFTTIIDNNLILTRNTDLLFTFFENKTLYKYLNFNNNLSYFNYNKTINKNNNLSVVSDLNKQFFNSRINIFNKSNLIPSNIFKYTIKRKLLKIVNFHKFSSNIIMWYYNILIRFMENCSGKKVYLKFAILLRDLKIIMLVFK